MSFILHHILTGGNSRRQGQSADYPQIEEEGAVCPSTYGEVAGFDADIIEIEGECAERP